MTIDEAQALVLDRLCREARAHGRSAGVPRDALQREPDELFRATLEALHPSGTDLFITYDHDEIRLGKSRIGRCEDTFGVRL